MTNASNTMVRRASELDAGSRVIVGGAIHTVVKVHDIFYNDGRRMSVAITLENNCTILDRADTLFTCVACE